MDVPLRLKVILSVREEIEEIYLKDISPPSPSLTIPNINQIDEQTLLQIKISFLLAKVLINCQCNSSINLDEALTTARH